MALTIIRLLVLCFLLLIPVVQTAFCRTDDSIKSGDQKSITRETPVVRWTANRDQMNFRYNFLENLETITLHTAKPETGTWNHHQHIFYFKGVFFVHWDSHIKDENGSGQNGFFRRSADQGKTWSPAKELFPPLDRKVPAAEAYIGTRFQTFNGFAVVDDVLYAVTDVADWTGPSISERKRISVGRLCRSVSPDGTLGELFWLRTDSPKPVDGFPTYPPGKPNLVKKIKEYFQQPGNEIQLDFTTLPRPVSDDNHRLTEPVPSYRLTDGTWVRLYRDMGSKDAQNLEEEEATKSRRNYASFSFDDGKTWTIPTRTSFPDACARSTAGKLPDGQVYVINNVLPLSTKKGGRSLLAISLSRDGLNFDRVVVIRFVAPKKRYKGRAKSIGFAYPHSVVVGDYLWIIYSVNKEDIQLTRIPLTELYKL